MGDLLFICTGNSCRSQMAEAWARMLLPAGWRACSAGVEKHGLDPFMLRVMKEAGVDTSALYSKTVEELPHVGQWDIAVAVCSHAAQQCPIVPAKKMLHMPFDDPPALARHLPEAEALVEYRRVRDEIRLAVARLAESLATLPK